MTETTAGVGRSKSVWSTNKIFIWYRHVGSLYEEIKDLLQKLRNISIFLWLKLQLVWEVVNQCGQLIKFWFDINVQGHCMRKLKNYC